ncbi:hypothetical protein THRCLA_11799 [Thraustotheca clavata]|uniref:Uncharacterized protein n=1 Tax=Thraustotheca clavata TaxID=74557 RepID=A0A1V9Y6N6_9STRA|nr:hypothetical protein THRCLA_11799 [Thraustotheca clavata]
MGRTAIVPEQGCTTPRIKRSIHSQIIALLYVYSSLACGLWYLSIIQPTFNNDIWWAGYNVSGYQAFLIDITNNALTTMRSGPLDLFASTAVMPKQYNSPKPLFSIYPTYPWRVVLNETTSIEFSVTNLRTLSAQWSTRMMTQYCWVDFSQQWELGHTLARQNRCKEKYWTNGAVYLEAMLRNVEWGDFMGLWSGPGNEFTVAVQIAIEETTAGQQWLNTTSYAKNTTTIVEEISYWKSFHIAYYQLQWANKRGPGITESLLIQNAFGIQQQVTLKNMPLLTGTWSSEVLYWRFLNDIFVLQTYNRSMVRQSANFFALNISTSKPPVSFEVYQGICSSPDACTGQSALIHYQIGPFLSIDTYYLGVPSDLINIYSTFQNMLYSALQSNSTIRSMFTEMPEFTLYPIPPAWEDTKLTFYGGNPMCLHRKGTTFPQQSFTFSDACIGQPVLSFPMKRVALILAIGLIPDLDATAICATQPNQGCISLIHSAKNIISCLPAIENPPNTLATMGQVKANYMQFAMNGSTWVLLQQPLVTWPLFGFLSYINWIEGAREIISFEGDVSTTVLISNYYPKNDYTSDQDESSLKQATQIVTYFVLYTSFLLFSVAIVATAYALWNKLNFVPSNLIYFNRFSGSVWIGRPLQIIRGVTALCVLSTAPVELIFENGQSRLKLTPRPFWASVIIAGESTWVIYVVNDLLLLCFSPEFTRVFSPLSSLSVWLITFIIDALWPVNIKSSINRDCYCTDMDYQVHCSSGLIEIGSSRRLADLVIVQIIGIICSILIVFIFKKWILPLPRVQPPHSVAGVCTVYLTSVQEHEWVLDKVVCVLSGMIPLKIGGEHYIFDVMTWVFVHDAITYEKKPIAAPSTAQLGVNVITHEPKRTRSQFIVVVLGLTYMILSISGSVSYLSVSEVNLANDIWWAKFNITGTHVFLANWFNYQMYVNAVNPRFSLANASISQLGSFDTTNVLIQSPTNFGSYLQHAQLNALRNVIIGMRDMDACENAPWIFTQYCFVDFNQTWSLANTQQRFQRCKDMTANGAVYLETLLRNIRYEAWQPCWGNSFDIAIGNELQTTQSGKRFLEEIQSNKYNSVTEEVNYWKSFGIQTYDTEWQNFKKIGLISTYTVESAYGIIFPLTLQSTNGTYVFSQQTTFKGYWGLANDFAAISTNTSGIGGLSLIRSSPIFAFSNQTIESILVKSGNLSLPFSAGLELTRGLLGPFGSIDMYYIPVPRSTQSFARTLMDIIRLTSMASSESQIAYADLSVPDSMYPAPPPWLKSKWLSYGGSPLCSEIGLSSGATVSSGMLNLLSSNKLCSTSRTYCRVGPTTEYMVVSTIMAQLTTQSNFTAICAVDTASAGSCPSNMRQTVDYVNQHIILSEDLSSTLTDVLSQIRGLQIELMQFMRINASSPLTLQRYGLLQRDDEFAFSSWILLADWVLGGREVVKFVGDRGNITLITDNIVPAQQGVRAYEIPTSGATYARSAVQYITFLVIVIAGLTSFYIVRSYGHVEGRNMFSLGSVGGVVWIGRPLLFLRSITAIGILSTGTLELTFSGYISYLRVSSTPWYATLISANELTWLAAVVNDFMIAHTREYNRYYNAINVLLIWLTAGCLSIAIPPHHIASIAPTNETCSIVQMDFQIVCQSVSIQIGQLSRFIVLVLIVCFMNVVCYTATRCFVKNPMPAYARSVVLYAGAKYLFQHRSWIYNDMYYLDRASAVLNGLLTFRWHDVLYVLDIKTWRVFAVTIEPLPSDYPFLNHAMYAVPLKNVSERSVINVM